MADQTPAGYVVAGRNRFDGPLVADWDGEVHASFGAGHTALVECRAAGYEDWQLYALVPAPAPAASEEN